MGSAHEFPSLRENIGISSILACLLVMVTSAVGVLADSGYNGTLLRFDNMDSAIETITQYAAYDPNVTDYLVSVNDKIIGISNFTFDSSSNLTKRLPTGIGPTSRSWTQYQTAQQGTWWSQWYPASCERTNFNWHRPTYYYQVTARTSYSASWDDGFDLDFGIASAASNGYTVTQTNTQTDTSSYFLNFGNCGQVWQQQLVVWQDQQSQNCRSTMTGHVCDSWSPYYRGNLPVDNGQVFSWSLGCGNVDSNSCGGGN